jgi:acetyl esterase/lipase
MRKIYFLFFLTVILFSALLTACTKEETSSDTNTDITLTDTVFTEVAYGAHTRQTYDIYLPENRNASTPVVLMIHGGAWSGGHKSDLLGYVNLLRTKWPEAAVVNMNYRLASNEEGIHHPQLMEDIAAVLADVRAHASAYTISDNIAIMGFSAGAQLAMIHAYAYDAEVACVGSIFGPSIINDYAWYSSFNIWLGTSVEDVLTEYVGMPWDSAAYSAVSPYWNVTQNSQPTILFHGSLDPIVPVYQSQWMHGKLNTLGVTNEYHEYLAFHAFDANQNNDVMNKLVAFFQNHIEN